MTPIPDSPSYVGLGLFFAVVALAALVELVWQWRKSPPYFSEDLAISASQERAFEHQRRIYCAQAALLFVTFFVAGAVTLCYGWTRL